jgi:DNA-binding IclR family transcriptional regulator
VLASLPADGSFVRLTELADAIGMARSTVHRYLRTLVVAELAEHDATTHRYCLVSDLAISANGAQAE